MSGFTVPVTTNSGAVAWDGALAPGNRTPARPPTVGVRPPGVVCPGGGAAGADLLRGRAIISARRRNAASPRPIGNIGVAIPGFRPPGDVLFGHPVKRGGSIVHVGLV